MDKSSLSWAAVFDLAKEAKLVGVEFSWLGSVVYCKTWSVTHGVLADISQGSQLVCQPISAYALIVSVGYRLVNIP